MVLCHKVSTISVRSGMVASWVVQENIVVYDSIADFDSRSRPALNWLGCCCLTNLSCMVFALNCKMLANCVICTGIGCSGKEWCVFCSPFSFFSVAELVYFECLIWFEVILSMLRIKCLFLSCRKWDTIEVNVCNTNAIGSEKCSVGAGVGIVVWKKMSCSYHLYHVDNTWYVSFFMCTGMKADTSKYHC